MGIDEVLKFIEENKGNTEVMSRLQGVVPVTFTVEGVQKFITENKDAKSWFDSEKDKHHNKSLDTWKTNNLQKAIDEEINKRFPEESEEKKMLKKIEAELANEKSARVKESLKNKAITYLTGKGIPVDLADHFLGENEESTTANLTKLETVWSSKLQEAVEAKFKENGRDVHNNNNQNSEFDPNMSMEQYVHMREKQGYK